MPTLFKRSNGIYYLVVPGHDGSRRWISTGERTRARALQRLASGERRSEEHRRSKRLSAFSREFISQVSNLYSKQTLSIYGRALKSFLAVVGDLPISSVNAQQIDHFRQRRLREISPTTVNLELRTLKAAFSYAVRWQLLSANPFTRVPLCRIPGGVRFFLF